MKEGVKDLLKSTMFKAVLAGAAVFAVVGAVATAQGDGKTNTQKAQTLQQQEQTETPPADNTQKRDATPSVITTKEEKLIVSVPHETQETNDKTLAKGATKIKTAGKDGEEVFTYRVTYRDGIETGRELLSTKVTKKPVKEVVRVGTYVAPAKTSAPKNCANGTYKNSAGNIVCRPSSSPAGATARCKDGTYSYSQSRRGTCSHHGGVSTWL